MIGAAFGAAAFGGRLESQIFSPLLRVCLGDYEVTNFVESELSVSLEVNSRGTCNAKFVQPSSVAMPVVGSRIRIEWNEMVIFSGQIEEVEVEEDASTCWLSVNAVDWHRLLDRYIVAATFVSLSPREIVRQIIEEQTGLWQDGVSYDEIPEEPTVEYLRVTYKKASDAVRELARLIGMDCYVDHNRSIRFFDRATNFAPHSFGDLDKRYHEVSLQRSLENYRNIQYLRAGKGVTDEKIDYIPGATSDPSVAAIQRKRAFILKYPVAELIEIKRNGITQRIGVRDVDQDNDEENPPTGNWLQWFYAKDSNEISQNSYEDEDINPTLKDDEVLEITYTGYYPMVIRVESDVEIENRKTIEGGAGEYWSVEEDQEVDGEDFAIEKTTKLLQREGYIPYKLRFKTFLAGLSPGQIWNCTISALGMSAVSLMTQTVQYSFLPDRMRCSIEAISGLSQESWQDFFRRMAEAGRKIGSRSDEKFTLIRDLEEGLVLSDSISTEPPTDLTLESKYNDPFSYAKIGTVTLGGRTVGSFQIGRSRIGNPA